LTARLAPGGVPIYVIHDIKELDIDPTGAGVRVVVSGHSHRPASVERGGVLYINPGSAGRRRFSLPIAAGELLIEDGQVRARLVTLAA
jgi:predicted phosphodiesterase